MEEDSEEFYVSDTRYYLPWWLSKNTEVPDSFLQQDGKVCSETEENFVTKINLLSLNKSWIQLEKEKGLSGRVFQNIPISEESEYSINSPSTISVLSDDNDSNAIVAGTSHKENEISRVTQKPKTNTDAVTNFQNGDSEIPDC